MEEVSLEARMLQAYPFTGFGKVRPQCIRLSKQDRNVRVQSTHGFDRRLETFAIIYRLSRLHWSLNDDRSSSVDELEAMV